MKLLERWRQEAGRGLWCIDPAKQEQLGNSSGRIRRFSKQIEGGNSFGQRLKRRRFNFSEIPTHRLRLFVRAGAVDGDPAEVFGNFHQALVVVVPLG